MVSIVSAQDFGPVERNTYVVRFLDPNGPLPEIGGEFDGGWAATFNDGTNWLEYTDPENDQDPENGPRTDDFHFYAGILNGDIPRFYMGINGTGFTPTVGDGAPTENDVASWWNSSLYEVQLAANYPEDPRSKMGIGFDGHWSDFQRNPSVDAPDFTLTNLEIEIIDTGDGFAVELAFDIDDNLFLSLDDPEPDSGITWFRVIVSIQGGDAPLVVWPDGDFNGNVNYITHGSSGWDHFGWFDVTSEQNSPVAWQVGSPIPHWDLF